MPGCADLLQIQFPKERVAWPPLRLAQTDFCLFVCICICPRAQMGEFGRGFQVIAHKSGISGARWVHCTLTDGLAE